MHTQSANAELKSSCFHFTTHKLRSSEQHSASSSNSGGSLSSVEISNITVIS